MAWPKRPRSQTGPAQAEPRPRRAQGPNAPGPIQAQGSNEPWALMGPGPKRSLDSNGPWAQMCHVPTWTLGPNALGANMPGRGLAGTGKNVYLILSSIVRQAATTRVALHFIDSWSGLPWLGSFGLACFGVTWLESQLFIVEAWLKVLWKMLPR